VRGCNQNIGEIKPRAYVPERKTKMYETKRGGHRKITRKEGRKHGRK
jgi:hypothetical protein